MLQCPSSNQHGSLFRCFSHLAIVGDICTSSLIVWRAVMAITVFNIFATIICLMVPIQSFFNHIHQLFGLCICRSEVFYLSLGMGENRSVQISIVKFSFILETMWEIYNYLGWWRGSNEQRYASQQLILFPQTWGTWNKFGKNKKLVNKFNKVRGQNAGRQDAGKNCMVGQNAGLFWATCKTTCQSYEMKYII